MKILFITEFFPATLHGDYRGGVEARTYIIARYLAKKHSVWVIASHEKGKPDKQVLDKVNIIRVGPIRSYTRKQGILNRVIFTMSAIWTGIKLDFDIVEGAGFFGFVPAYLIGLFTRKKRLLFLPDLIESYAQDLNKLFYVCLQNTERLLLRQKWNGILCISNSVKKKINRIGVVSTNIKTIYCGVDLKELRAIKVEKDTFPTICTICRLVPYKKVTDLVLAVAQVKKKYPNIRCLVVGDGEDLPKIQKLVRNLNLSDSVLFYGFFPRHKDVIKILKRSHLFCLPSTVEGFGIASVEAMVAGIPRVVANIEINHEIGQNSSLYFNPGDIDDLTGKILLLLNDKNLYVNKKRIGLKISQQYNWQHIAKKTESWYESVYRY